MRKKSSVGTVRFVIGFFAGLSLGAALADGPTDRITRVEHGLLPMVTSAYELGARKRIDERMRAYGIPGLSITVIDDGSIVWSRAYGLADIVTGKPTTTDTVFQAASISKPVAAVAALTLVGDGALSLDEDVNSKLKSWQVPSNEHASVQKVTLRRIMSHTAGLTVHGFPGYAAGVPIPSVRQVLEGAPPANTKAVFVDTVPGSLYRYSGGGYTVMQQLLMDVSGQPFDEFMKARVLDRIGMNASTYALNLPPERAALRASGHLPGGPRIPGEIHRYPEAAAAGLWTTADDLARFMIFILRAQKGEERVLDRALTREMLTPHVGQHGLGLVIEGSGESLSYGHNGVNEGFEAVMFGYPASGDGLVIMANANAANPMFREVLAAVALEYGWPETPYTQRVAQPMTPSLLRDVPGRYEQGPNAIITVTAENDCLIYRSARGAVIELFAASDTELFAPQIGPSISIDRDAANKVVRLRMPGRELRRL